MLNPNERRRLFRIAVSVLLICFLGIDLANAQEALTPIEDGKTPQTYDELWSTYNPRAEPLDVEILHKWEEGGVAMKVLRYRVGIFKGQKVMMAAVYGYPKGGDNLPGLVQIHGGGQYADYQAVLANARRGYATISIAWAGRISATGYRVNPDGVKLFWEGKTDDPNYRVTTDWGSLDAYHAPHRNSQNGFHHVKPADWTLDIVDSPRNNPWFLCTLGARRALTFLGQQPQVDGDKLGVYGHSMGGKLTVLTTGSDDRVKASAPSCGGISNRAIDNDNLLYQRTIADDVYLKHITCPIIFLSPANDFHGRIVDLPKAIDEIQSKEWRVTCSPHHSHQDTPTYEVATLLWFDEHLKNIFTMPKTPEATLEIKPGNVPSLAITVDERVPVLSVDVYYTQHGKPNEASHDREITTNRFWHHAKPTKVDERWVAEMPISTIDRPLLAYANVLYALEEPVTGAGYYYRTYTANSFNLSSLVSLTPPEQLASSGVRATLNPTTMIETFEGNWEKEWFTYKPDEWARATHKLFDDQYKAPENAQLALDVLSDQANELVILIDDYAADVSLQGGDQWQKIVLSPTDFENFSGEKLNHWNSAKRLTLAPTERLTPARGEKGESRIIGRNWRGENPQLRNLRWLVSTPE